MADGWDRDHHQGGADADDGHRHERRVDAEQGGESADEHVAERDHPGGAAIAAGHAPVDAFLSGYRWGLLLAAGLVVAGGAAAFAALRRANHDDEREPTREDLVLAG